MCTKQRWYGLVMLAVIALGVTTHGKDFMGDWRGTLKAPDGATRTVFAQVINWGKGEYQANILESIYTQPVPEKPLLVLRGKLDGQRVQFGDSQAAIAAGTFRGATAIGELDLQPYRLESPTLGLAAPAGAEMIIGGDKGLIGSRRPLGSLHLFFCRNEGTVVVPLLEERLKIGVELIQRSRSHGARYSCE